MNGKAPDFRDSADISTYFEYRCGERFVFEQELAKSTEKLSNNLLCSLCVLLCNIRLAPLVLSLDKPLEEIEIKMTDSSIAASGSASIHRPVAKFIPVSKSERIGSIDVLRGFALLGILMMNVQSFGLIDAKYLNPMAQGELTGLSYYCWLFAYVFFDLKFMSIFSMLFGAGIVLMWERSKAAERNFTGLHYRRMFWLLLIGLAHAHLLWHGDILVPYAMCGMLVYWFCGLRARWLIPIGIMLLIVGSGLSLLTHFSIPFMNEADLAEMSKDWVPTPGQIKENLAVYRGSWLEQMPHRSMASVFMETFLFLFLFVWRIGGLMLIGMAMFKSGVFSASKSNRFYATGMVVGAVIGLTLVLLGVQGFAANDWSFEYSFFLGNQFNCWGSVSVALSYVCMVMLVCKNRQGMTGWLSWLRNSLAAVGQMALTNYLAHTIICTTIFYGHGLGWFGYLNRIQMIGIVLVIWVVQLVMSPVWLKHFRFGPFEWLWRSLSYWKWQPFAKEKANS